MSAMVIGDIPPWPGWVWPRGPFCMPLSTSSSPILASSSSHPPRLVAARCSACQVVDRTAAAIRRHSVAALRVEAPGSATRRITDDAVDDEPVPYEQDDQRAHRGGDEAGALVGPVPAEGLAQKRGEERAHDSKHGRQNETAWIVRTRRQDARDDAGDKSDEDDPENAHGGLRSRMIGKGKLGAAPSNPQHCSMPAIPF